MWTTFVFIATLGCPAEADLKKHLFEYDGVDRLNSREHAQIHQALQSPLAPEGPRKGEALPMQQVRRAFHAP